MDYAALLDIAKEHAALLGIIPTSLWGTAAIINARYKGKALLRTAEDNGRVSLLLAQKQKDHNLLRGDAV